MLTYKLYLIRHGMTQGNKEGFYTGRTDVSLCDEGIAILNDMAEKYVYPDVEEIYCSPLKRCQETAEIIYPNRNLTLVDDLVELSLGDFEGKKITDLQKDEAYQKWIKDSLHNNPPASLETGEGFAKRIANGINSVFMNMMQENITKAAVITHGGVIMGLMSGFAFPRLPMGRWAVYGGSGFEISMTTQMWMRDNAFEFINRIPDGFDAGEDASVNASFGIK
ncbi:MAG: histidine phosphatase family protein [Oscillospiraceae bacterium]